MPPERIGADKTTWAALRASCAPAGPATERLAAFRRRPGRIRAGAAHVDARGFVDRTIGNPIDIAGIAYAREAEGRPGSRRRRMSCEAHRGGSRARSAAGFASTMPIARPTRRCASA
ncbi:conserved hypothetical protein [Burkholderia pseudomallei 668]|nr:conserved hypothetical protein [Burkholderia pseudomallei 668]